MEKEERQSFVADHGRVHREACEERNPDSVNLICDIEIPLVKCRSRLQIRLTGVGQDIQILIWGGDRPHIGCCVMAVPRLSLTGDGSISVTSSVMNRIGHKDEYICRMAAEYVAKTRQAVTVCLGGFHMDDMTKEQIEEVIDAVKSIEGSHGPSQLEEPAYFNALKNCFSV